MDNKQSGAVILLGIIALVVIFLAWTVQGLDSQYDDPCANQSITECETSNG